MSRASGRRRVAEPVAGTRTESAGAVLRVGEAAALAPDDVLVVLDGREVHRLALGGVPREPAALRAWLRQQHDRLFATQG